MSKYIVWAEYPTYGVSEGHEDCIYTGLRKITETNTAEKAYIAYAKLSGDEKYQNVIITKVVEFEIQEKS